MWRRNHRMQRGILKVLLRETPVRLSVRCSRSRRSLLTGFSFANGTTAV